jgi:uncharacterized protein (DUF2384 family)
MTDEEKQERKKEINKRCYEKRKQDKVRLGSPFGEVM